MSGLLVGLAVAIYLFMAVFFGWVAVKAGEPIRKSILMGATWGVWICWQAGSIMWQVWKEER